MNHNNNNVSFVLAVTRGCGMTPVSALSKQSNMRLRILLSLPVRVFAAVAIENLMSGS